MANTQYALFFSLSLLVSLATGIRLGYTSFEEPTIADPASPIPDYADPLGEAATAEEGVRPLEAVLDGAVLACEPDLHFVTATCILQVHVFATLHVVWLRAKCCLRVLDISE